ncbi:MAG TPA: lysoplasmalogenase [Candidatus Paceibacterota bacterium]|jgi:uncharacterized membrane protein YhhN|nr:lysoplasmalogenase [Candidatus Paceibacterota bacterium]HRT58326.1 lysoplasmalogenase [Candidatus Paceibacterota bacterium]
MSHQPSHASHPRTPPRPGRVFPPLFLLLGAVSGLWVLGARSWFATWHGFPNTPLTTLFFLAAAATASGSVPSRYRWSVVAGLGFSALGDLFLMLPKDHFVAGLSSFLAAHLCYLWALTMDHRLAGRWPPFALWGVVGLALIAWLWPAVPSPLRLPVLFYTVALLGMAAQAASRAQAVRSPAAVLAAAGAALFVVSDAVLAIQRFRQPFEGGRFLVLGTYFAAQAGIALSVVLFPPPPSQAGPAED